MRNHNKNKPLKNNLSVLLEISRKMNSNMELYDILPAIVEVAKQYVGVARVSVFLLEGDRLYLKAYAGFAPSGEVSVALGEGVTGSVASTGEQVVVNDKRSHEKTAKKTPFGEYLASSYISLPIVLVGNVIGVLNLTDKINDHFTSNDLEVAEYIASQCSMAVERHTLYEKMRGTERLQTIGMMRAAVAHDIRNLMGIVEVYLSLMEDSVDPTTVQEYLGAIRTEIQRVQGLTEDIMEYSKQNITLKRSLFDISELCKTIAEQLNLSLRFTDICVASYTPSTLEIFADKDRLYRAIFNLANNAAQAIDEKGEVIIRLRNYDSAVSILVYDNGKGIPREILKDMFNPFVTSGKPKGTGLGLAIVKEIAVAHGGTIQVRSSLGKYTAFLVKIPKVPPNDGQRNV